jgi:4-coumarate--CoA ligase
VAYVLRHLYGIGANKLGEDVVLTVSSGNPFIPCIFYAVVAAGGIFSGASTSFRVDELVRQLRDAKPKLLICTPEYEALVVKSAEQCGIPRDRILALDSKTPRKWRLNASNGSDVLRLVGGQTLDWARVADLQKLKDVTICLLYSSGTTGLPKGVRISHWGLVASTICTMDVAIRYQERSRKEGRKFRFDTICHLPMANIAGVGLYSCNPFYMGGSTYWMEKYDFDQFIDYHQRYRPAYQFSVPPVWLRVAKSEKVTNHFDGLQVACTGSAPIGYATVKELRTKLGKGKAHITQTWGTTETSGVITALDWHLDDTAWSVGAMCPNVTLRILDEHDQDVESGQPGELIVGGSILAQGYHNNPKITEEAFIDGFYRTGDIGVCKNGLVHIVDRKKELIKYKGNQVAPAELEALLTSHPGIADAAVIGIWNAAQQTELPRAYVVQRMVHGQSPLTEAGVANFVKESLADHKRLRGGVIFVDEIPKSASGKILRKDLRATAAKAKI